MEDKLLTLADLTDRLQVSAATIRRWRRNGNGPPAIRLGLGLRFRAVDVEAWLEQRAEVRAAG